jgi:branched-chain amino acid aminotransferase
MSMADRDGKIWFDGKLVEWRDAKIHVLTHTLHYGMGVFEGVRAYDAKGGTAIFRLEEHTQRLFNSAKIFQMNLPFSYDEIVEAQKAVVRANNLASCYLRPIAWIGSEKLGVAARGNTVHMAVAAWPWGAYLGEDGLAKGIRIKTSSYTRHHVNVSMVRAKASGYYVNSILANAEVTANGYDEALLLDTEGYVSEGAGENVFMVRAGKLYTPDVASCLDGITRNSVITIAQDLGIPVIEKRITRDEMYCADEAFFTGTAAEITPIRELDDRTIGAGKRGPITEKLQAIFFDVVAGKNKKYARWLTPVAAKRSAKSGLSSNPKAAAKVPATPARKSPKAPSASLKARAKSPVKS